MEKKYEKTYQEVVEQAISLNLSNCSIDAPLSHLVPTLEVCKDNLKELNLSKNRRIKGALNCLCVCKHLRSLNLGGCAKIIGKFDEGTHAVP